MPPLISGEWGYSNQVWGPGHAYYPYTGQVDVLTQGKHLARMWLVNALEGAGSIWCKLRAVRQQRGAARAEAGVPGRASPGRACH